MSVLQLWTLNAIFNEGIELDPNLTFWWEKTMLLLGKLFLFSFWRESKTSCMHTYLWFFPTNTGVLF